MTIAKRKLGKTGVEVTMLGLGGEGVLRTFSYDREAYELINRAIDLGITYCESARAYQGSESYYGRALHERRKEIFLTSKSHARDKKGALQHLAETLENMGTDHLDLWQIHDVRSEHDLDQIFGKGGAIEAFEEAKKMGMVRFIGVTGHHDPGIIRAALDRFPFDTVLMPVNPVEPAYKSFLEGVMPEAVQRGVGVVGMKVYIRGLAARVSGVTGLEQYFRFALSQPVSTVVIGCDDVKQLEMNVQFAERFQPMSSDEQDALRVHLSPIARPLMYYKPE